MFLILLAIILILRLPAFWTPILDVDESQFAGFASTLLDGGLPYVDSVDTKPLGIYWFFAAIFFLFGRNNMIAVHAATALLVFATALYCYRIARRLYSERAGQLAALFYAVFTTTYIPKFISTSIVIIMMLPLTMSIFYTISWEERRKDRSLILAGLLFGVACLFKYQAGINLVLVALYFLLFAPLYLSREPGRPIFRPFLIFTLSSACVGLLFFTYLKWAGVWEEFRFWSIEGSLAYIETGALSQSILPKLAVRGGAFVASGLLLWYFGGREVASLTRHVFTSLKHSRRRLEEYLILFWFFLSVIPVCTGGRFFGHYFIQLLPALAILASAPASRLLSASRRGGKSLRRRVLAIFAVGLIIPSVGFFTARVFADQIYTALGEDNPNSYRPLGEYVRDRTDPDQTIFVWGFATPTYFFAHRRPASRFLWCDWLTGRTPGSPTARNRFFDTTSLITRGSWEMLFEDLKKNRPVYFIDTSVGNYHDYIKYPIDKYRALADYIRRHYRLEARHAGADFYRRIGRKGARKKP